MNFIFNLVLLAVFVSGFHINDIIFYGIILNLRIVRMRKKLRINYRWKVVRNKIFLWFTLRVLGFFFFSQIRNHLLKLTFKLLYTLKFSCLEKLLWRGRQTCSVHAHKTSSIILFWASNCNTYKIIFQR